MYIRLWGIKCSNEVSIERMFKIRLSLFEYLIWHGAIDRLCVYINVYNTLCSMHIILLYW